MADVIGAIRDKWVAMGAEGGVLGVALDVELPTFDGVGRAQEFAGGTVSWNPELGAFATIGAIRDRWFALGREQFGYLITDELGTPDGRGRFNHYRTMQLDGRPEASIYWTPETGAHEVIGGIRTRWVAMGFETSFLGYPTTGEVDFTEGGRVSLFEHGAIYWWPDTGPIDLGDVVVRYRGMNCFGETDNDQLSTADEPYCVIGVVRADGTSTALTTPIEEDVDGGDTRPNPGMEVYRGAPHGVTLATTLMEHDFGDPDHYRKLVDTAVSKGADQVSKGVEAATTQLAGPAVAAVASMAASAILAAVGPDIAEAINSLLDTGDDRIGVATTVLSAKALCTLVAAPLQQERNVVFHVATDLISGQGASYKAYYDVVRA
jgi:hypothetical protein